MVRSWALWLLHNPIEFQQLAGKAGAPCSSAPGCPSPPSGGFSFLPSDVQCVTQREGKSPVPFSKLETYPGGWGFYPLSILCLIRSAKITASVMIEFRAGDGRWRHRSTLESRRFFGCPLGVLPAEGGKSGVNDPMGISNRIY